MKSLSVANTWIRGNKVVGVDYTVNFLLANEQRLSWLFLITKSNWLAAGVSSFSDAT